MIIMWRLYGLYKTHQKWCAPERSRSKRLRSVMYTNNRSSLQRRLISFSWVFVKNFVCSFWYMYSEREPVIVKSLYRIRLVKQCLHVQGSCTYSRICCYCCSVPRSEAWLTQPHRDTQVLFRDRQHWGLSISEQLGDGSMSPKTDFKEIPFDF